MHICTAWVTFLLKIETAPNLKKLYTYDFAKSIREILKKISEQNLVGLHKIQILDYSPEKRRKDYYGFYYGRETGEKQPRIVICVNNIIKGYPDFVINRTFITKLLLADTLFHEVAHHIQSLRHGINKSKSEDDAKKYVRKMMWKHFKYRIIFLKVLLSPLAVISSLLIKVSNVIKRINRGRPSF